MNRRTALVFAALPLLLSAADGDVDANAPARGGAGRPYDPTDRYEARTVEGWPVLVNRALLADAPGRARDVLTLLGQQLYQVKRQVPPAAVAKLRKVRIWVEDREGHHPCMAYHPDPHWLAEHGMNPEKAGCVEVADTRNFLKWTHEQPWMVLHELAHAYHHQFLKDGFANEEVASAYRKARAAGSYDAVLHWDGKEVEAYATRNPMEYFAEASEAYFGANDFYPFVRAELRAHDPEAHDLLRALWGAR